MRVSSLALCASDGLLGAFGGGCRAWYLKVTVTDGTWGDQVFFLSVHPLEYPMQRVGGMLSPAGVEEER